MRIHLVELSVASHQGRARGLPNSFLLAGLAAFSLGCATGLPEDGEGLPGHMAGTLAVTNGMTPNGLATNGLATNGLATNGLATNGLTTNGLTSASFSTWFNSNPAGYSDMVMKYVVACAYDEGQSLSYSDGITTFTWYGRLGIAPGWASGNPATVNEQQLISACLAAHVNKFGAHVDISIRGPNALGNPIPVTTSESSTFSEPEAAFFGNLFTGEGIYTCNARGPLNPAESSARACGLSSQSTGTSIECPPIQHAGQCTSVCLADRLKGDYSKCSIGRKSFLPLTTHLKPSDIYKCGDGTCQLSESCDSTKTQTGTAYDNCNADCGVCGL